MTYDIPNARLAWPLEGATYRYFTNVEAARERVSTHAGHWGDSVIAVDDGYPALLAERRDILARDPKRTSRLPHMHAAEWDALLFVLTELSATNPQTMTLSSSDDHYHWRNEVTGDEIDFIFGENDTLPAPPLSYAASQVTEDLFLLDERDNALHLDAIAATFTGAWSSSFSLGMTFSDLHGPVPRVHAIGMVDRTQKMILSLAAGEIVRRLNWSIYDAIELDSSLESAGERPAGRLPQIIASDAYGELRMRIEIQHLVKLPLTDAVLFTIAYQLAPLSQLADVPEWRDQLISVIGELPDDMAAYKNFGSVRSEIVTWLEQRAVGAEAEAF